MIIVVSVSHTDNMSTSVTGLPVHILCIIYKSLSHHSTLTRRTISEGGIELPSLTDHTHIFRGTIQTDFMLETDKCSKWHISIVSTVRRAHLYIDPQKKKSTKHYRCADLMTPKIVHVGFLRLIQGYIYLTWKPIKYHYYLENIHYIFFFTSLVSAEPKLSSCLSSRVCGPGGVKSLLVKS